MNIIILTVFICKFGMCMEVGVVPTPLTFPMR